MNREDAGSRSRSNASSAAAAVRASGGRAASEAPPIFRRSSRSISRCPSPTGARRAGSVVERRLHRRAEPLHVSVILRHGRARLLPGFLRALRPHRRGQHLPGGAFQRAQDLLAFRASRGFIVGDGLGHLGGRRGELAALAQGDAELVRGSSQRGLVRLHVSLAHASCPSPRAPRICFYPTRAFLDLDPPSHG